MSQKYYSPWQAGPSNPWRSRAPRNRKLYCTKAGFQFQTQLNSQFPEVSKFPGQVRTINIRD